MAEGLPTGVAGVRCALVLHIYDWLLPGRLAPPGFFLQKPHSKETHLTGLWRLRDSLTLLFATSTFCFCFAVVVFSFLLFVFVSMF